MNTETMSKRSETDWSVDGYAPRAGRLSASGHAAQIVVRFCEKKRKVSVHVSQEWQADVMLESLGLC